MATEVEMKTKGTTMKNSLRRARSEFASGENVDVYVTIAIAVLVAILSFFNWMKPEYVSSATLLVLASIVYWLLVDRWSRQELLSSLKGTDSWEEARREFRDRLQRAKTVSFLAVSPLNLFNEYKKEIKTILSDRSGEVCFLVVNPQEAAMNLIVNGRPQNKHDGEIFLNSIKELRQSEDIQGKLIVRKIDFIPSCIVTLIDTDKDDGVIFTTIYSFKQCDPDRPSKNFNRSSKVWFPFFRKEFSDLWEVGTDCN